jgi:hypothetical protein
MYAFGESLGCSLYERWIKIMVKHINKLKYPFGWFNTHLLSEEHGWCIYDSEYTILNLLLNYSTFKRFLDMMSCNKTAELYDKLCHSAETTCLFKYMKEVHWEWQTIKKR